MKLSSAALSVALFAASACARAAGPPEAAARTFSEKDAGTTATFRKGQAFAVTLETIPATGFNWTVAKRDPAILELVSEETENPPPSGAGATVHKTFRFRTIAAGRSPLRLAYRRPWEKDTPPAKTFSLEIVVEP